MEVVSNSVGFALRFKNKEDLKHIIDNLQDQLEWIEQENIQPPYIYFTYEKENLEEKVRKIVEELKGESQCKTQK
ncbi:MAG: hypothetical protein GX864_03460 [Mollicutes bacterium]|jgi:hypothetical protein|nr:hypothetical protein [Mollicutes bacterium]